MGKLRIGGLSQLASPSKLNRPLIWGPAASLEAGIDNIENVTAAIA
jgi:hypothetical protein